MFLRIKGRRITRVLSSYLFPFKYQSEQLQQYLRLPPHLYVDEKKLIRRLNYDTAWFSAYLIILLKMGTALEKSWLDLTKMHIIRINSIKDFYLYNQHRAMKEIRGLRLVESMEVGIDAYYPFEEALHEGMLEIQMVIEHLTANAPASPSETSIPAPDVTAFSNSLKTKLNL